MVLLVLDKNGKWHHTFSTWMLPSYFCIQHQILLAYNPWENRGITLRNTINGFGETCLSPLVGRIPPLHDAPYCHFKMAASVFLFALCQRTEQEKKYALLQIQIKIRVWTAVLGPLSLTSSFNQSVPKLSCLPQERCNPQRAGEERGWEETRSSTERGCRKEESEGRGGKIRPYNINGSSEGEVVYKKEECLM